MSDGPDTLEERLRQALTPPPDQVERVVLRSLAVPRIPEASRRDPRLRRLVPASFLALLVAAAAFFSMQLARPRQEAVVSIVNIGGVVIATSEEEERPLILSGAGERPSSGIILIRRGE